MMPSETDLNRIPLPAEENWKFIDELKKARHRHFAWTRTEKKNGEADLSGGIRFRSVSDGIMTSYSSMTIFSSGLMNIVFQSSSRKSESGSRWIYGRTYTALLE